MSNETQNGAPRRLILMRGLPSCGKSWTARRIAAEEGGVRFEFDAFFERADGESDGQREFHWSRSALPQARRSQFEFVCAAVDAGISPIVADDDHRPGPTAKAISSYALSRGYEIELREPDSPWWQALRPLLANKQAHAQALGTWAQKLCRLSASEHRVSLASFAARIERWDPDMTLLDILAWGEDLTVGSQPSMRTVA